MSASEQAPADGGVRLGLRKNLGQFARLVLVNAFVVVTVSTVFVIGWSGASSVNAAEAAQTQRSPTDPWTRAQTVGPGDLVTELAKSLPTTRPTVVCVGVQPLYRGGHVPGAVFHGPAASAAGLADLRRWAQGVSRTTNVVLYCGCCPFAQCPNMRPAFTSLRDMGFTHLRVLMLPNNLATDWAARGYPVER